MFSAARRVCPLRSRYLPPKCRLRACSQRCRPTRNNSRSLLASPHRCSWSPNTVRPPRVGCLCARPSRIYALGCRGSRILHWSYALGRRDGRWHRRSRSGFRRSRRLGSRGGALHMTNICPGCPFRPFPPARKPPATEGRQKTRYLAVVSRHTAHLKGKWGKSSSRCARSSRLRACTTRRPCPP